MTFSEVLLNKTEKKSAELMTIPSLVAALQGRVTLKSYINYLEQAYHHVKHTVPILMSAGSRLLPHQQFMLDPIAEYIEEEKGHEEWILNDINRCGGDADRVRDDLPSEACEFFVSYIYDRISRANAASVFGMVHVLEGTSIQIATGAADRLKSSLQLPKEAFTYLYSHGSLDIEHYEFFRGLMDKVTEIEDQQAIVHTAARAFVLYGNIFRTLEWQQAERVA